MKESEVRRKQLQDKTMAFALDVIQLTETLPGGRAVDVLARQLLRSATSVGANYRAACRAQSRADFIAKMSIVEEEADESYYWLKLLDKAGFVRPSTTVDPLLKEADELTAIAVSSIKSARKAIQSFPSAVRNPKSAMNVSTRSADV